MRIGLKRYFRIPALFFIFSAMGASFIYAAPHNIYSDPVLTKTSGTFDRFLIDFYGEKTPGCTYWALCNWDMDASAFMMKHGYTSLGGEYSYDAMGAYAGLQTTESGSRRNGIMSFWDLYYKDSNGKKGTVTASRIFPSGSDNHFDGEGTGTNWICNYPWKTGKWYRMAVVSWKDAEKGTTFVGQWVKPVSTGKWTLLSYFDTKLTGSYMVGGLSQFQEVFRENVPGIRRFRLKNMYAYDHSYKKWVSLNKTVLSYDPPEWGYQTSGPHKYGASSSYFWGEAGGIVKDEQANNRKYPNNRTYTIRQASRPTLGKVKIKSLKASRSGKISWSLESDSSPQLEYKIIVKNASGNVMVTRRQTRPEVKTPNIRIPLKNGYKVTLKIKDIFGRSASKTIVVK